MPAAEVTPSLDLLVEAARKTVALHEDIRAMRDAPDVRLNMNRVFSSVTKFGETILGDALAIFDEHTYPLVKEAAVGQIICLRDCSIFVVAAEQGKIQTHIVDHDGKVRFQVDWHEETPYEKRGLRFREAPSTEPGYHFQKTLVSAHPLKDEMFGIHPIALGCLDCSHYFQVMEALSFIRPQLVAWNKAREVDPHKLNHRRMTLINYEKLLLLDEGVAGPACQWVADQMLEQSSQDAMVAVAERFLTVIPEVQKLDVEWGRNFFSYGREDGYLTTVPTNVPGRTVIFDMWTSWSFTHQGMLAVLDVDPSGNPQEMSLSLLSRGNGEFSKMLDAAQAGYFEGMPLARYNYVSGEATISREFLENYGFEVASAFSRHTNKAVRDHNVDGGSGTEIVTEFDEVLRLDNLDMEHMPNVPSM